jgi:hypothetical protein
MIVADHVRRHPRSRNYIQWLTTNHKHEAKTNNVEHMLHLVYTVFGVCCVRSMLYVVSTNLHDIER